MKDVEAEFRDFYEKTFNKKVKENEECLSFYKIFCGGYEQGMKDCIEIIEKERKK